MKQKKEERKILWAIMNMFHACLVHMIDTSTLLLSFPPLLPKQGIVKYITLLILCDTYVKLQYFFLETFMQIIYHSC